MKFVFIIYYNLKYYSMRDIKDMFEKNFPVSFLLFSFFPYIYTYLSKYSSFTFEKSTSAVCNFDKIILFKGAENLLPVETKPKCLEADDKLLQGKCFSYVLVKLITTRQMPEECKPYGAKRGERLTAAFIQT